MTQQELPPVPSSFATECLVAREMAESAGLLSMGFALDEASIGYVIVTNRKAGISCRFPRTTWLELLRAELASGKLGTGTVVGASMKSRLDLAREADTDEAGRS